MTAGLALARADACRMTFANSAALRCASNIGQQTDVFK